MKINLTATVTRTPDRGEPEPGWTVVPHVMTDAERAELRSVMFDMGRLAEIVRFAAPDISPLNLQRGLFELRCAASEVVRLNERWGGGKLTATLDDVKQAERDARQLSEMRATLKRLNIAEDGSALRRLEARIAQSRSACCPPLKSEGKTNVARWCGNVFLSVASIGWNEMTGHVPKPGKSEDPYSDSAAALPPIEANPYANFIFVAFAPVSDALGLDARSPAALYVHLKQTMRVGKFIRPPKSAT